MWDNSDLLPNTVFTENANIVQSNEEFNNELTKMAIAVSIDTEL